MLEFVNPFIEKKMQAVVGLSEIIFDVKVWLQP